LEEYKLQIFEKKILRRIFGPCMDENTEQWSIRKNKELEQLYERPDIVQEIKKRQL